MSDLQQLLNCGTPEVERLASTVVRYNTMLSDGKITADEYKSLCEQLLDIERVQKAATSDKHKMLLEQGVNALRFICALL